KNRITEEKSTLYHTSKPSLSEISLPKTPVNPARTMARCINRYVFFIKGLSAWMQRYPVIFEKSWFAAESDHLFTVVANHPYVVVYCPVQKRILFSSLGNNKNKYYVRQQSFIAQSAKSFPGKGVPGLYRS